MISCGPIGKTGAAAGWQPAGRLPTNLPHSALRPLLQSLSAWLNGFRCLSRASSTSFFPKPAWRWPQVIERLGYAVDFPEDQTCCGQPAFNSGYRAEARTVARHFLKTFEGSECVVAPSGSCTAMVTHHYAELFHKEPETLKRVQALAGRVFEFSTFLTEVAGVEDVGARFEETVTFHDGCHGLRELGIRSAPRRLLAHVRGLELREMEPAEECCGFGGTFAVKFPELSGGHGAHQDRRHRAHRRAGGGFARLQLPDADPGRALPRRLFHPHACIWPRCWPAADHVRRIPTENPHRRWPTPTCNWPSIPPPDG